MENEYKKSLPDTLKLLKRYQDAKILVAAKKYKSKDPNNRMNIPYFSRVSKPKHLLA